MGTNVVDRLPDLDHRKEPDSGPGERESEHHLERIVDIQWKVSSVVRLLAVAGMRDRLAVCQFGLWEESDARCLWRTVASAGARCAGRQSRGGRPHGPSLEPYKGRRGSRWRPRRIRRIRVPVPLSVRDSAASLSTPGFSLSQPRRYPSETPVWGRGARAWARSCS